MRFEHKPLSFFKKDKNIRVDLGSEAELRQLGESMREKQLQPVLATLLGLLVYGYRRLAAAELVGLSGLWTMLIDEEWSDGQRLVTRLAENFHRKSLSIFETWMAFSDWMSFHPEAEQKHCAAAFKVDESTVTRYLRLSALSPACQEALKAGKLPLSVAYQIATHPHEQQESLLNLHFSGVNRDAVQLVSRQRRNGRQPSARASRIKCQVNGYTIVVSGQGLTLETFCEVLPEAVKQGRKGIANNLTGKEFNAINQRKVSKKESVR